MITINGTTESIEIVTGSAVEIHYDINYSTFDGTSIISTSVSGSVSTATTREILSPFDGTQTIHRIKVKNVGGSSCSVLLQKKDSDGPVVTEISKLTTLDPEDLLEYENFFGWKEKLVNNVYVTTGGGSGGGISLYNLETDANFSVVDYTVHEMASNTLTADRTINVSALTTECEIVNGEQSYRLTFTGGTVYRNGGAITETEIMSGATTHLRKVGTKIIIIN